VAKEVFQRAFQDTYGLELQDVFTDFDRSVAQYRTRLGDLGNVGPNLPNKNYDVGEMTRTGEYRLEDNVRASWLHMLAKKIRHSDDSDTGRVGLLQRSACADPH